MKHWPDWWHLPMSKTPEDNLADFCGVYDFEQALAYQIQLDEAR